ncbi:MAG TPA: FG-GAP-like repeat-containing protein [Pyrinomonadaceae bacterium]|nr:FG-GAP-like repeat-containing protein [Pyrinomonadaceae bacterium]
MKLRTALMITVIASTPCLSVMRENSKQKFVTSSPATDTVSPTELSGDNAIRHLKETGEFESLGAAVTAARYAADSSGEAASVENHANQIRATFSPGGMVLESTVPNATLRSLWRLRDLDRGNHRMTATSGDVETSGSRVTIKRHVIEPGSSDDEKPRMVEEWFNNTPGGLEHGFTLPERLSEGEENLRLKIAVEGDLEARADDDGQTLRLVSEQGEAVLNYEKLRVWDADGAEVAARMTTESGAVVLEVEDASSKYPLVIDPTFSASGKLTASDGLAGDWLGFSVAISGDTAVVGAPGNFVDGTTSKGFAYVFVRAANRLWTQQAKLSAPDGAAGDTFGFSLAISGDTTVVGAPRDQIGSNPSQGSAYVFVRNGNSWSAQEKLTAADGAASDAFGTSLTVSGDTAIIGATGGDGGVSGQGAAYAFVRSGGIWTQQQKLFASDGSLGDGFGGSVALSGSTVVIGSSSDDIGTNPDQGSAYVYTRSGTVWALQQKLLAPDGTTNDSFGRSVGIWISIFGNASIVAGAPEDVITGLVNRGSGYVFVRTGTTWTMQQKLISASSVQDDYFGTTVAISGGNVIIGAQRQGGRAFIYTRSGTTWNERTKLTAFDGAGIGLSVAISGETAIAGAYRNTIGNNSSQGSAYLFDLGAKPFDFDDDGRADIGIFRPAGGEWWVNPSSNGQTFAMQFGQTSDKIVPADFTGDGKTDVAVFRPANGNWYILRSEDSSFYAFPFGASADIPAPADYDGDRIADAAVFRPSNNTWYISRSTGGNSIQQFGATGDVPVVGDYDGDRRADIAIYRPNGVGGAEWWIARSSTGQVAALQFGNSTDKAVPSDYTGDGKTDVAFWRPGNGNWFVLRSEDLSFYAFPFGANGDTPAPGDYDGDGKSDAAVFRSSNSTWYITKSSGGATIQQFGAAGDVPVASAFLP